MVGRAAARWQLFGDRTPRSPAPDFANGIRAGEARPSVVIEHESAPTSHDVDPPLLDVGDQHFVACHLVGPGREAPQLIDAAELRA